MNHGSFIFSDAEANTCFHRKISPLKFLLDIDCFIANFLTNLYFVLLLNESPIPLK